MFLREVMGKIGFSSLIAVNEMLTSPCDNLSTYIPSVLWHAISWRPDHATVFSRCCHVFEEKAKAIELLLSKESGKKKKKGNRFDKDWADKHAASDKGSYDKQHEFEEGRDFEEAAIDGFLKPYKAFIKDQTARQRRRQRGKRVRGIRRQALLRWEFLFHWSQW